MGLSLNYIMLLGRWASSAVLGYVEEAISEMTFGSLSAGTALKDDWEQALPALSARIAAMETKMVELRRSLDEGSAARVKTELLVTASSAKEEPAPRRWVRSTRANGRYHREASRRKDAPSWAWCTGCGWRFGLSLHYEFVTEEEAGRAGPLWCDKGCDLE